MKQPEAATVDFLVQTIIKNQDFMRSLLDNSKTSLDYYAQSIQTDADGKLHYHPQELEAIMGDLPPVLAQYKKDFDVAQKQIEEIRASLAQGKPYDICDDRGTCWSLTSEVTQDDLYVPILQEVRDFYDITEPIVLFEGRPTQSSSGEEEATTFDGFICTNREFRENSAPYGYIRTILFHEGAHIRHHDRALLKVLQQNLSPDELAPLIEIGMRFVERRNDSIAWHAVKCFHCLLESGKIGAPLYYSPDLTMRGYLSPFGLPDMIDQLVKTNSVCTHHSKQEWEESFAPELAGSFLSTFLNFVHSPAPTGVRPEVWQTVCKSLKFYGWLLNVGNANQEEFNIIIDAIPKLMEASIISLDINQTTLTTFSKNIFTKLLNLSEIYVNKQQQKNVKRIAKGHDVEVIVEPSPA